ncbi:inner kinetochore subunit Mcm16p [Monosporozyma unispora]|nr:hypothetical protein C6P44_000451 [Kazachstania unispora]
MNRNQMDPIEKIRQLERRHVQVHSQLLQALDELYLTKEDRQNFILSKEQEAQLKDRHALHMSIEKSVAIAKAMQRGLQYVWNENDELEEEREDDEDDDHNNESGAAIGNIMNSTSEDKLAIKLNQLSTDNYALDEALVKKLDKLKPLSEEYNSRRQEFDRLQSELSEITSKLPTHNPESEIDEGELDSNEPLTDRDSELERENAILLELTTALTHFSRNPRH